jgi:membrane protease YdiL (CAAX protease family)
VGESVLVAFVAVFAGAILGAIVIVATRTSNACGPETVLSLIGTEIGILLTVLFWVRVVKHAPLSILGMPKEPLKDLSTGLVGGVALYVIAIVVSVVVVEVVRLVIGHPPNNPSQVEDCVTGPWLVLTSASAVIFAPLGEETLFRGFVFQGFRSRFAFWPAAILDGILFGLIHIPFWLLIPSLAVVGVGLAYIYNRRHSLLASMTAHATFNLIGVVMIALSRR